jgi:integrase
LAAYSVIQTVIQRDRRLEVTKVLTQRAAEAARAKDKRYTIADGIVPGLNLIVQPSGGKVFRLFTPIHREKVALTIGDFTLTTLADARAKAKALLAEIAAGGDPRESKRKTIEAAAETVSTVAADFIARYAMGRNKSWQETERQIARNILPSWGRRPITSITQRDAVALLDGIVDRGAPIAANRVLAAGRKMFNWARERGLLAASPFDHVKAPTAEKSRDRTPDDAELALILRAADTLGPVFGAFFKLLAYTGQRRDEVAQMPWSELNADMTLWTLPPARTKNELPHTVPIAPEVQSILAALPRIAGSDYVLTTTGKAPISGYSKAKIALDAAVTKLNDGVPLTPWRIHDLRRSIASDMARMGVQLPVVEKIINHTSGSFGGVQGVYQRHEFRAEKRQALEQWARHLRALTDPTATAEVVTLHRA